MLTQPKILLGRGTQVESSRLRKPGGLLCHVAYSLRFMAMGLVSRSSLDSHLVCAPIWSNSGPSWWHTISQPRWIPA